MRSNDSASHAKRWPLAVTVLLMVLAAAALGLAALGSAGGLGEAAGNRPRQPTRSAIPSGSLAPGSQPSDSQPTSQHGPRTVHFDLLAKLLADDRRNDPDAWRRQLADPQSNCRVESQPHPLLSQPAPDFTLVDHRGQSWNLGEQLAQGPVVVVFYLGYSCNACVHHLCELSADVERFREFGAQIVAISADAPELTRQRFDQYGSLGFPVLSDSDHAVAGRFGTLRPAAGSTDDSAAASDQPLHGTFIVDRGGVVRWANRGEVPFRASMALLDELSRLDGQSAGGSPGEAREARRR